MSTSWIYLLNSAVLISLLFYLLRFKEVRGETYRWFLLWLLLNSSTGLLYFFSRAIDDRLISLTFLIAGNCVLTAMMLAGLCFARSFGTRNDFFSVMWSIPALFNASFFLVAQERVWVSEKGIWRFDLTHPEALVPISVIIFYSLATIYYLLRLYLDVRRGGEPVIQRGILLILLAFILMFLFHVAATYVRQYLDPRIPVSEVGNAIGAIIICVDLSWIKVKKERVFTLA